MTRRRASLRGALRWSAHLRVGGVFIEPKLHGIENTARKLAVAQPLRALLLGRLVQCRTQQRHLGKIVEMSSLKRGVLPVVRESSGACGRRV